MTCVGALRTSSRNTSGGVLTDHGRPHVGLAFAAELRWRCRPCVLASLGAVADLGWALDLKEAAMPNNEDQRVTERDTSKKFGQREVRTTSRPAGRDGLTEGMRRPRTVNGPDETRGQRRPTQGQQPKSPQPQVQDHAPPRPGAESSKAN